MNNQKASNTETLIEKGNFLIAEPFAQDDIFKQSIILIADHSNQDGTVGFIINKKLQDVTISDLINDLEDVNLPVYIGGPVNTDSLYFIHSIQDFVYDSIPIFGKIHWGGRFEQIKGLAKAGYLTEDNFKFFVGYTGWTAGQLREEIYNRYWIPSEIDEKLIFNNPRPVHSSWSHALKQKGETFAILSEIPKFYHQN